LTFVNVKTLIMLMLFLEQVRGRPGVREHHVGDPCSKEIFCWRHSKKMCVEPTNINASEKCWKLSSFPKCWGPRFRGP